MSEHVTKSRRDKVKQAQAAKSSRQGVESQEDVWNLVRNNVSSSRNPINPRSMSPDVVLQLQRTIGNQAVMRLMEDVAAEPPVSSSPTPETVETHTITKTYPFEVTIRRGPPAKGDRQKATTPSREDAPAGHEGDEASYMAQIEAATGGGDTAAPAESAEASTTTTTTDSSASAPTDTAAPAESAETSTTTTESTASAATESFRIPDIEIPALAEIEKTDSVAGTFTYSGSINRGGAQPSGFGVTRSFGMSLTSIVVTPESGAFKVTGTWKHPITWQVRSGTGPSAQKDIASETDGKITKTNYPTVVSDLKPNMSDLNGRPPRTQFWAEDLTIKHEKVHADDDKSNGPGAMATATTWLNTQTASSAGDVTTLLGQLPGRFATALLAALSTEDGEKHAYGDGAPSYTARANAIKAKGVKGDYA